MLFGGCSIGSILLGSMKGVIGEPSFWEYSTGWGDHFSRDDGKEVGATFRDGFVGCSALN